MLRSCTYGTLASMCAMKGIPIEPLAQWRKDLTYYLTPSFFCLVNWDMHYPGSAYRGTDLPSGRLLYVHTYEVLLTISDLRCCILLCRLSKWSWEVLPVKTDSKFAVSTLQRAWRDALRCCQPTKKWRDNAKWWVGTVELTCSTAAIDLSHSIRFSALQIPFHGL